MIMVVKKSIRTVIVAKTAYDFIGIIGIIELLRKATAEVSDVTAI